MAHRYNQTIICSIEREGIKQLGPKCAKKLRVRMVDLRAASCLEDLRNVPATGRLHELKGQRKGQFAIDLQHPYRLIMEPAKVPPPQKEDGGIDWVQVTSVRILEIIDYH